MLHFCDSALVATHARNIPGARFPRQPACSVAGGFPARRVAV